MTRKKQENESGKSATGFDPSRFRVSQDFAAQIGVRESTNTVEVRRPKRQEWIRTNPREPWAMQTCLLDFQEARECYLVDPDLWGELQDEIVTKLPVTSVSHAGGVFLWPIKLPDTFGKIDPWNESALAAALEAENTWTPRATLGSLPASGSAGSAVARPAAHIRLAAGHGWRSHASCSGMARPLHHEHDHAVCPPCSRTRPGAHPNPGTSVVVAKPCQKKKPGTTFEVIPGF